MDPAVAHAHQSALRSIARVVEESAPHTEPGRALGDVVKQLAASLGYKAGSAAELLAQFEPDRLRPDPYTWHG